MPALVDRPQARAAKPVHSNYLAALEVAPLKSGWFGLLCRLAARPLRCRPQAALPELEASA